MKNNRFFIKLKLGICLLILGGNLVGCGANKTSVSVEQSADTEEEIVIPILLRSEPDGVNSTYSDLITGFNKKYKGKYQLDVTLISETEEGYRTRLKELNAIDDLPVIITDAAFGSDFLALMEENNRYYGLYPLSDGMYSSAGMFYNVDILKKCGIDTYPATWDEFLEDCEIIKSKGYTPISLHGGGDYWSALLIGTAYMCRDEAGVEFLNETLPESYDNKSFREMLNFVDTIYDYTFSDALNISHDESLSRFISGEAAMIPGGYWMVSQIEGAFFEKGFSSFCGGIMLVDKRMSAWGIVNQEDEKVMEGAKLFMEYRSIKTDLQEKSRSDIGQKYIAEFECHGKEFPNYQLQWQDRIIKEDFDVLFPKLIKNDITENDFINQLSIANN